jgi:chaperonin GroEL (HSP60 family)
VADIVKKNKVVAGGGAIETEVAKRLKEHATKVGGREQLAVEAFAGAIESIPKILAENAGLDPIDVMVALRSSHERADGLWMGVNILTGEPVDMMKEGVIEPVVVKEQAVKSAVEAASMILRVDDVIAAAKPPPMPPRPPGGPEGEGMPPM